MSQLSPPIQAVLELFVHGPLADQRFADVDAAVLSELASTVEAAAAAVAEQEAQLSELRQTLADRQDALLLLAQRALAYARVYAEHDDALTEQLSRISLPRAGKPRKVSAKPASSEASAASSEASAASSEASAASSEASAASSEASAASSPDESAAEPTTETVAFDAPSVDAQAPRKGKRRSSVTRDEAQDGPV